MGGHVWSYYLTGLGRLPLSTNMFDRSPSETSTWTQKLTCCPWKVVLGRPFSAYFHVRTISFSEGNDRGILMESCPLKFSIASPKDLSQHRCGHPALSFLAPQRCHAIGLLVRRVMDLLYLFLYSCTITAARLPQKRQLHRHKINRNISSNSDTIKKG